jgi:hypothetical protein
MLSYAGVQARIVTGRIPSAVNVNHGIDIVVAKRYQDLEVSLTDSKGRQLEVSEFKITGARRLKFKLPIFIENEYVTLHLKTSAETESHKIFITGGLKQDYEKLQVELTRFNKSLDNETDSLKRAIFSNNTLDAHSRSSVFLLDHLNTQINNLADFSAIEDGLVEVAAAGANFQDEDAETVIGCLDNCNDRQVKVLQDADEFMQELPDEYAVLAASNSHLINVDTKFKAVQKQYDQIPRYQSYVDNEKYLVTKTEAERFRKSASSFRNFASKDQELLEQIRSKYNYLSAGRSHQRKYKKNLYSAYNSDVVDSDGFTYIKEGPGNYLRGEFSPNADVMIALPYKIKNFIGHATKAEVYIGSTTDTLACYQREVDDIFKINEHQMLLVGVYKILKPNSLERFSCDKRILDLLVTHKIIRKLPYNPGTFTIPLKKHHILSFAAYTMSFLTDGDRSFHHENRMTVLPLEYKYSL